MRSSVWTLTALLVLACAGRNSDLPSAAERSDVPVSYEFPALADSAGAPEDVECSREATIDAGVVSVFPGQTICVELQLEGGFFTPRAASTQSPHSLVLTMSQVDERGGISLKLFNPYSRAVKYRAGMRVPGRSGYYNTSSCGVFPGASSYEMWPHPVEELVLADFHFVETEGGIRCN